MTDDRATILLVDDQPQNLLALEAVLEPLGHELVSAQSGEQALRELLHRDVAVILLDVQMPGIDGFETAELIKERERTRHIPIIFLTAISKDSKNVYRGYSTGAVDYMFKPFEPSILLSKVSVFVELWQKTREIRRQAELLAEQELAQARRESEKRYRSLAESIPQQVWIAGPDGTLEWTNARLAEYFGAGNTPGIADAAVHPEEADESRAAWEQALAKAEPFEREFRLRRADGVYRWHLTRAVPVRDAEGHVARWFGTNTDIDDRKRAEEGQRLLVHAGELLAGSLDLRETLTAVARAAVPDIADWCAISMREEDGSVRELAIVHVDSGKARLAEELVQRYPPKQHTGAAHVIATGQSLLVPKLSDKLLRAIAVDELHLGLLRELGLESYLGIPLVVRGETMGAISLVQAESGRRYDEKDLAFAEELARRAATAIENAQLYREAEERARAARVLETVGDGVAFVDRDGVIRLWNPAAEAIVGLPEAAVVGRRAADVIPAWDRLAERIPVATGPGRGEVRAETLPLELAGRELWLSISGVGSEEGTVYAFRDLTDERALEAMKSDFVATVSHELRTPLAAIHGSALTILRPDLRLDDELRDRLLQVIAEESERLANIVNDLLVASHLDSGRMHVSIERCDARELAETVLASARTHLPESVRLELAAPDGLAPVAADAGQLRQVLGNLVENAIKYSPEGGTVRVGLAADAGVVRFAVSDEGLGIPPSEHRRVFEKFYRLDPNMTRGIGGTGLGLYISRELVRTMGGRIWVESALGVGSTFYVEIPQAAQDGRRAAPRQRERAAADR